MSKDLKSFEQEYADSAEGRSRIRGLQETIRQLTHGCNKVNIELCSKRNTIRFGIISDTHFGSNFERLDALTGFLKCCRAEKIDTILHSGDVFAGHGIYKGQEFELHAHGWDEQKAHAIENVPCIDGLTIHFITGNHDASFTKNAGVNPGREFSLARPDWRYLGQDQADITLRSKDGRSIRVALIHPDGGTAYALSYKPQKIIEAWEGGAKPNLLAIGHFHKAEFIPAYRNVMVLQSGCFEDQTPFMKRKPTAAHVGGWIVEVMPGAKGSKYNRVRAEFIPHY